MPTPRLAAGVLIAVVLVGTGSLVNAASASTVSCTNSNFCVALGGTPVTENTAGVYETMPLARSISSAGWSSRQPIAVGAYSELNAISCTAADWCMSVGEYGSLTGSFMLSETFDGANWHIIPGLAGDKIGSGFSDVWCAGKRWCVAASLGTHLFYLFNGRNWTAMVSAPLPSYPNNPPGSANLASLSCSRRGHCIAVGFGTPAGGGYYYPWGERLAHGHWNRIRTKLPGAEPAFEDVSCPTSNWCAAISTDSVAGSRSTQHFVTISGARVTTLSHPVPAAITALSCVARGRCVAVGPSHGGSIAITLVGTTVSRLRVPRDLPWVGSIACLRGRRLSRGPVSRRRSAFGCVASGDEQLQLSGTSWARIPAAG
jgi:hypothetical protein